MALQLNKISRGLLQNRRFIANSVDLIANNKELHADCPAQSGPNSVPDAVKTLFLTQGSSNLLNSSLIRGYSNKSGGCKLSKCPKFFLEGCQCPRPCERKKYIPCKKRPAPYPSYSEACVEELTEDPSECVQCPWRHCPDFHPKWRGYHTGSALNRAPFVPPPPPAVPNQQSVNKILDEIRLYEKPLSPCEKRRRYLEQLKKEQEERECEHERNKRKKRCLSWTEAVARFYNKQNNLDILADQIDVNGDGMLLSKNKKKQPPTPCDETFEAFDYDPREADYEHKRKRLNQEITGGCCPKKGELVEDITMHLDSGYAKCPKKKRQYPDVDHTTNEPMPRDCPVCKKESTCCNSTEKPRKYKKKPLKCPTYECMDVPNNMMLDMDGPPNAANGLNVDLDGDVEVHKVLCVKRRNKRSSCQICMDDTWCNYCRKPCTETCRKLRKRGPYKRRDLYGPSYPRHMGRDRYEPPC